MLVRMKWSIPPISDAALRGAKPMKDAMRQPRQIHRTKDDQHQTHGHLHRETQSWRNHDAEGDDCYTRDHDREGVPDAPNYRDECRAVDVSTARNNGADGD